MNEDLDKLSLLCFLNIHNTFSGLYMTPHLRVWYLEVDVRLGDRYKFELHGNDLSELYKQALENVTTFYKKNYPEYL